MSEFSYHSVESSPAAISQIPDVSSIDQISSLREFNDRETTACLTLVDSIVNRVQTTAGTHPELATLRARLSGALDRLIPLAQAGNISSEQLKKLEQYQTSLVG